jgi:1-deoxy-D-xylulose-5-phosphate reductoisomerase
LLAEQVKRFRPRLVAVNSDDAAARLERALLRLGVARTARLLAGEDAAAQAASSGSDVVLNGITGAVGLVPTLSALGAGSTLALANKDSLVVGGALVKASVRREGQIVPVDSEHSAIAQCLRGGRRGEVDRLILTASGGPFRGRTRGELAGVGPDQALAHPTWSMGPVVTINSSTMVNKALELIEAHLLFDVPPDRIDVVVHPQSMIHSMVAFRDGAILAQASPPDMRLPIALGLSWPERLPDVIAPVDFTAAQAWTFEPLDSVTFPAVDVARFAIGASPLHPAVMNAANEVCVRAFLDGRLGYLGIVDTVSDVVFSYASSVPTGQTPTLDQVIEAEAQGAERAEELVKVSQA